LEQCFTVAGSGMMRRVAHVSWLLFSEMPASQGIVPQHAQ